MSDPALYLGVSALLIALASILSRLKSFRSLCCSFSLQNGQANTPVRRWLQSLSRTPPAVVDIALDRVEDGVLARRRGLSAPEEPTSDANTTMSTQV